MVSFQLDAMSGGQTPTTTGGKSILCEYGLCLIPFAAATQTPRHLETAGLHCCVPAMH